MIQKTLPYLQKIMRPLNRFKLVIIIVVIGLLYGYLVLQISSASNAQPSAADQALLGIHVTPRVDPSLVQKLQQLQDNSVSVQALFNNARTNPFQN